MASLNSNPISDYVKTSIQELKKVTWPTRQETAKHAFYVIVMSLVMAAFFGVVDYLLTLGVEKLISL